MRRIAAALLMLCVTAATVNNPAGIYGVKAAEVQEANTESTEDSFEYEELANGGLKLTKYKGSGTKAVIPSAINGKTVTIIGNEAFSGCTGLESITIPESVTNIGEGAGYTEYEVFDKCSRLKEIIVDVGNVWYSSQDGILYNKEKTKLILCPAGKEGTAAIAEGVTEISYVMADYSKFGYSAFSDCSSLTGITIPESLITFLKPQDTAWAAPYQIFSGCSSLEEILAGSNHAEYSSQDGILYNKGMTALLICPEGKKGSITIPASVTYIGRLYAGGAYDTMFHSCKNLTDILVDDSNEVYSSKEGILYNKEKTELICCPAGKTGSVTILEGVTAIRNYAFSGCGSLTEITIPAGITEIEEYTFNNCSSLAEITVPDGVETIGNGAFNGCSSLTKITIPKSVMQIGARFEDGIISALEETVLGNCSNLEEIIVDSNNRVYSSQDGVLYSKDMAELILCPKGKKGRMEIPQGVQSMKYAAVANCKFLTGISIPESLTDIGLNNSETNNWNGCGSLTEIIVDSGNQNFSSYDGVLYGEDWDEGGLMLYVCPPAKEGVVQIPTGVTNVLHGAFLDCRNLTEIKVDNTDTEDMHSYYSQDGILFLDRKKTTLIACPAKKEGNIVLDNNVVFINSLAFHNCSRLTSITIRERTYLSDGVFDDCNSEFHIYCIKNSKAEEYAQKHGISYTIIGKKSRRIELDYYSESTVGDEPYSLDVYVMDIYGDDTDATVSYESSNESVISVSSKGLVTIVGSGTAEITITAAETEEYEAAQEVITITVNPKPGEDQNPDTGNNNQQNSGNKKVQTITAADIAKTYGDRQFPIGAGTDSGGTLSYTVKNPAVAAIDGNGTVTLKGCGRTEVVIIAAAYGEYMAAEKTITLTVAPKKLKGISAKPTKTGTLTVKWKKDTAASGYIIECSTDRKFRKNVKTITVKKNKTTSKKITKLKSGKKYYVRACAYAQAGGAKIKGAYTAGKKAVKVKK